LAISSTAVTLEKAPLYWEIFDPFIGGEIGALSLVAEERNCGRTFSGEAIVKECAGRKASARLAYDRAAPALE
jgi:hypothetical protein